MKERKSTQAPVRLWDVVLSQQGTNGNYDRRTVSAPDLKEACRKALLRPIEKDLEVTSAVLIAQED